MCGQPQTSRTLGILVYDCTAQSLMTACKQEDGPGALQQLQSSNVWNDNDLIMGTIYTRILHFLLQF